MTAPIALGSVLIVVLIISFRPEVRRDATALVEANLRRAVSVAHELRQETGSLAGATPLRLREVLPDLLFIDADQSSNEPGIVSVSAADGIWAGAARSDAGTCFWIRTDPSGATETGTGTDCSGEVASAAQASGWPDA